MRLPQSSSQPLSLRFVSTIILLTLAAMVPEHARGATKQTEPFIASPTTLQYGSVIVGDTQTLQTVVSNTGDSSATITAISVSTSDFSVSGVDLPVTLSAGQSVTLNITFTPSADGWTAGTVTISGSSGTTELQVGVRGAGVKNHALTLNPSSVSFGQVPVGSTVTSSITVTNSKGWDMTIKGLQTVGGSFAVSGPSFPVTLAGGGKITISVSFTPQAAGEDAGSIFLSGPSLNIPLSGTGTSVGQLTISPTSLSFGSVNIGNTTTQPASLTATGGAVTISSASSSNSQFSLAGVSLPLTINAGNTVAFDVVFDPTAAGTDTGSLSFSSNSNTISESLSGTGVQPTYSVNLSWNASTSQVAGYNVYRGTAPGTYSKINSALDPNTAYTDSTVVAGTTYYYAATSVNSSGQESTYSPAVEVAVP